MSEQAVLLVNLGSPDSPSVSDVRRYLREFLMDGRVLDVPAPLRFCIVNFGILPRRPKQSARAYRMIWTTAGSPLVAISRRVQRQLQDRLTVPVELAMRYGNPSIAGAIGRLRWCGAKEVLVVPMFPQYAMSSYETAVVRVQELAAELAPEIKLNIQPPYYNDPDYMGALVGSAEEFLTWRHDHLLFSFHGLPERHLRKSDPTGCHCLQAENCCESESPAHGTCYRHQCFETVKAFVAAAGIPDGKYSVAFQSRLGRDPWLKPYTDFELVRFAETGVRKLLVICPAFVSDCLETLEEIGMRGRETFLRAGGSEFNLIPCLNEHPLWIDTLEKFVLRRFPESARRQARPEHETTKPKEQVGVK